MKLFDEVKKLSKSAKKIKTVKKEKIEQSIQKTKKSTQSKMNWWIFGAWISGAVGFVIYLIVTLGSGGSGGTAGVYCSFKKQTIRKNLTYGDIVTACTYICSKGNQSKLFYYLPNGSGPNAYCPGFPQYWSNEGRYKNVEGSFIFPN